MKTSESPLIVVRLGIEEPGLAELVSEIVLSERLSAVEVPVESDVFIIAVPTPIKTNKNKANT